MDPGSPKSALIKKARGRKSRATIPETMSNTNFTGRFLKLNSEVRSRYYKSVKINVRIRKIVLRIRILTLRIRIRILLVS